MYFGSLEIIIIVFFVIIILAIIPVIFYLKTLQKTLEIISVENQKMKPGLVWMVFIPGFGIVWQFFIVNKLAESLKLEFEKKEIHVSERWPGKSTGMTLCILSCCAMIPYLGILIGIVCLVFWIIYWSKINMYKHKLKKVYSSEK